MNVSRDVRDDGNRDRRIGRSFGANDRIPNALFVDEPVQFRVHHEPVAPPPPDMPPPPENPPPPEMPPTMPPSNIPASPQPLLPLPLLIYASFGGSGNFMISTMIRSLSRGR